MTFCLLFPRVTPLLDPSVCCYSDAPSLQPPLACHCTNKSIVTTWNSSLAWRNHRPAQLRNLCGNRPFSTLRKQPIRYYGDWMWGCVSAFCGWGCSPNLYKGDICYGFVSLDEDQRCTFSTWSHRYLALGHGQCFCLFYFRSRCFRIIRDSIMTPAVSGRQTASVRLFSMKPSGAKEKKWLYLALVFTNGHIIVFERRGGRQQLGLFHQGDNLSPVHRKQENSVYMNMNWSFTGDYKHVVDLWY